MQSQAVSWDFKEFMERQLEDI